MTFDRTPLVKITKPKLIDLRTSLNYFVEQGWCSDNPLKFIHDLDVAESSVAITQQVYAHLHPDAFTEDYSRVAFAMPEKTGVVKLHG